MDRYKKAFLFFVIIILSLLISLGHILNLNYKRPTKDRSQYLAYAYNTLKYGIYSRSTDEDLHPDWKREPIWPLVLMGTMILHPGIDLEVQDIKCIARGEGKCIEITAYLKIINIILLMTCGLISAYFIYRYTNNIIIPILGFLMISLSGRLGIYAVSFFNEVLASLLIVLVSITLYKIVKDGFSSKTSISFSLALGILILTKALFYYFLFFCCIFLIIYWTIKGERVGNSIIRLFIIFGLTYLIVGPWIIRNYIQLGTLTISGRSGHVLTIRANLNDLISEDFTGAIIYYSRTIKWVRKNIESRIDPEYYEKLKKVKYREDAKSYRRKIRSEYDLSGPQLNDYLLSKAKERILKNPLEHTLAIIPISIRGVFTEYGYGFNPRVKKSGDTFGMMFLNFDVTKFYISAKSSPNILYVFLFFGTFIVSIFKRKYEIIFLLLPGIYFYGMSACFTQFITRYSSPLIPMYVICFCIVLYYLYKFLVKKSYAMFRSV